MIDINNVKNTTKNAISNGVPQALMMSKIEKDIEEAASKGESQIRVSFTFIGEGHIAGSMWERSSMYKVMEDFKKKGFSVCPDRSPYSGDTTIASGFVIGMYVSW